MNGLETTLNLTLTLEAIVLMARLDPAVSLCLAFVVAVVGYAMGLPTRPLTAEERAEWFGEDWTSSTRHR